MIIKEIGGGLGNQMFDYMLYLALKERRSDVKLSKWWLDHISEKTELHARKYYLDKVFNIEISEWASNKDIIRLGDYSRSIFARVRRRILKIPKIMKIHINSLELVNHIWEQKGLIPRIKRKLGITKEVSHKTTAEYRPLVQRQFEEIVSSKNLYLTGFFTDFTYVKNIEDKIRATFTFKNPLDDRNQVIADQMADEAEVSVSVHIRRGDYMTPELVAFNVCKESYFKSAMKYFTDRFGSETVHFYVFSDDIPWCRENIKADKITFIDWNTGDDSYRDMQLMSLCKHNIISNSTFSIWGAWLNANPDKIVIRPKVLFTNGIERSLPDEWIVMDN